MSETHAEYVRKWRMKKTLEKRQADAKKHKADNWLYGAMHAFEVNETEKIRYKKPVRNDGSDY